MRERTILQGETMRALALALACSLAACSSESAPSGEPAGSGGTSSPAGGSAGTGSGDAGAGGSAQAGGGSGAGGAGGSAGTAGGGSGAGAGGSAGSTASGGSAGSSGSGGTGTAGTLKLTTPAFEDVPGCSVENPSVCDVFPDENVSYMGNANISPELSWTGAPAGTQSFAVVLFDATYGQAHWALWNIPADVNMLAANVPQDTATPATPAGSRQANANFATTSEDGYFGPHIPCNVFEIQLYALSTSTFSPMSPESAVLVSIELQELGDTVLDVAKVSARANDYGQTCN
jgi:Raf kinase inhibitor-like YbhB/YbcL family protein